MKDSYSGRALIGAMNLLMISGPAIADPSINQAHPEHELAALNTASLKSIEGSWLQVPTKCKARGFNASPVMLEQKEAAAAVTSIYASFGA